MPAIQGPAHATSPAELDPERGKFVSWLLTIDGALAFDLFPSPGGARFSGKLARVYFVQQNVLWLGDL